MSAKELFAALLSIDNNVRSEAEKSYEALPLDQKTTLLFSALPAGGDVPEEGRQLAAVMLRRLLSTEFTDFFKNLNDEQKAQFKTQVLTLLQNEANDQMRRKLVDLVAEVSRNLMDDDGNNLWPEFLKFLFDSASSPQPQHKETSLLLFSSVPTVFGNQQTEYINIIKQMLMASLTDQGSYDVRFCAVKATVNYLLVHEKDTNILNHFKDLLAPVLSITMESIEKGDDDAGLKALIDLAESCPKFLRPQLDQLLAACIKVFGDNSGNQEDSWRHLALEVVVTLSETAPAMVRKQAAANLGAAIQAILRMMTEIDEEEDWAVADEAADDDSDSNAVVAESALDRMACGLGGKTMFPHILNATPQMLQQADWKYRHGALMAISATGEGCHKQMEAYLPQIMDTVMNFINDPHPRVRFACCNALGQMSTDFAPLFEKKFHDKVVPGLLHLMDDNANPRVQAHAGAALVNFSEDCPKTILAPYLDGIMAKLESILSAKFSLAEKGNKLVLEQIVTTLASVADTAEEKFGAYYDRFVPGLKNIIQNANTQELRLLRGKTIECISLIGLAVGSEKFTADAAEVMEMLLKTQTGDNELTDDDPQMSYMISAWARICKILGPGFAPYLPLVMGPIMKTASMKPEVALLDNDELNGIDNDADDWQFVSLGEQQNFGIKTAGLEDKATACQMLVCYARELKEHFVEYTEQTVKLMVPMLKFYFHDGVRAAAAESLPCLIECAKIRGPQYVQEMWAYICPELLKAIEAEPETSLVSEHLNSMARCIEILGRGCLNEQAMADLVKIMIATMTEHFERQAERNKKRSDEDYDEGVEEQLVDEDDEDVYTLSKLGDLIHALFSTHKEEFLPVFDQLLPFTAKLLEQTNPWSDHQWGLCIFDDLIEYAGPQSLNYQQHFVNPMLHYVTDPQPEVRQAAAYGCGVMGQHGGANYASICAQALPRLVEVIQAQGSREPENINPTENAISAVTKILKWNAGAINLDDILPMWFSWLPVVEDVDESPFVYGYLCDLIEANHQLILGNQNSNIPRIIEIFAEAFSVEALPPSHEVYGRMVNITRQVQGNGQVFEACVNGLTATQKQALSNVLSGAVAPVSNKAG